MLRTDPPETGFASRNSVSACAQTVYSEKQRSNRFPRTKKPAEDLYSQRWEVAAAPRLEKAHQSPVLLLPSKLFASQQTLRGVGGT